MDNNQNSTQMANQNPDGITPNIESGKTCINCKQSINQSAKICSFCNSYQSGWLKNLKPYENFLAIIISGLMSAAAIYYSSFYSRQQVDAAFKQIELAEKETAKAEEAKRKAEEASIIALRASDKAIDASEIAIEAQENANLSLVKTQNTLKRVNLIKDDLEMQRDFNLNNMSKYNNYAFIFFTDSLCNYIPIENYFNPISNNNSIYGKYNEFYQSYYYSFIQNRNDKLQYYSDLIEFTFIRWYSKYFYTWYQLERTNGILSSGSNSIAVPSETIKFDDLSQYFGDNEVLANTHNFNKLTTNWNLPPNVSIERKRYFIRDTINGEYKKTNVSNEIIFKHKLFSVKIFIYMDIPSEIDQTRIEVLNISNKLIPGNVKLGYCNIKFLAKFEKDFNFDKDNSRYYHWIKDLDEGIKASFDWHSLNN